MNEDNDFELLQIMYDTGDLIKLRGARFGGGEPHFFGVPTLHFMVKDTDIYLDVFPGVKRLQAHNHSWFRKIHKPRMFAKGYDRIRENIKPEYIVDELRRQGKHDLAKVILFNLDIYG
jgi:hypothetical protein